MSDIIVTNNKASPVIKTPVSPRFEAQQRAIHSALKARANEKNGVAKTIFVNRQIIQINANGGSDNFYGVSQAKLDKIPKYELRGNMYVDPSSGELRPLEELLTKIGNIEDPTQHRFQDENGTPYIVMYEKETKKYKMFQQNSLAYNPPAPSAPVVPTPVSLLDIQQAYATLDNDSTTSSEQYRNQQRTAKVLEVAVPVAKHVANSGTRMVTNANNVESATNSAFSSLKSCFPL